MRNHVVVGSVLLMDGFSVYESLSGMFIVLLIILSGLLMVWFVLTRVSLRIFLTEFQVVFAEVSRRE